MAISQKHNEFVVYIVDLTQSIGPVYSKRMFGGHGIFLDGIMFGLVFRDTFYLKVDKDSRENYKSRGLEPFSYQRQGKETHLNYFQAPDEVLDDLSVMRDWCNCAFATALRAAAKNKTRTRMASISNYQS